MVGFEPTETTVNDVAQAPPFTFSFDFNDDEHCGWSDDYIVEELPAALVARCTDLGTYELLAELRKVIDEHDQALDDDPKSAVVLSDDDVTFVQDSINRLVLCVEGGCLCASDAWESEKDFLDVLLASLWSNAWATNGKWVLEGPLTTEDLWGVCRSRDGYDNVHVTWDATQLDVCFSGYPGSSVSLTARPLLGPQAGLYAAHCDTGDEDCDTAWDCTEVAVGFAAAVTNTLDALLSSDTDWIDVFEVSDALRLLGRPLTNDEVELLVVLSSDWDQGAPALFEAATLVGAKQRTANTTQLALSYTA